MLPSKREVSTLPIVQPPTQPIDESLKRHQLAPEPSHVTASKDGEFGGAGAVQQSYQRLDLHAGVPRILYEIDNVVAVLPTVIEKVQIHGGDE